jgi:hypothetical protein
MMNMDQLSDKYRQIQDLPPQSKFYDAFYKLDTEVVAGLFQCSSVDEVEQYLETLSKDVVGKRMKLTSKNGSNYSAEELLLRVREYKQNGDPIIIPGIPFGETNLKDKIMSFAQPVVEKPVVEAPVQQVDNQEFEQLQQELLPKLFACQSVGEMLSYLLSFSPENRKKLTLESKSGTSYTVDVLINQLRSYQQTKAKSEIPRILFGETNLQTKVDMLFQEQQKTTIDAILKRILSMRSVPDMRAYLAALPPENNKLIFYSESNNAYTLANLINQLDVYLESKVVLKIPSIPFGNTTLRKYIISLL